MNDLTALKSLRPMMRDLDVYDVLDEFQQQRVFNNDECMDITNEPNEMFQIDLMLSLLEEKQQRDSQIVARFMDALRLYYDWIVERWEQCRGAQTKEYNRYVAYRNESFMPSHESISVYRQKLRWTMHKHLMSLRHGVAEHRYLFVCGIIGTGKQTLVCHACEDYTVVTQMNYKIFYLDLAYCNTQEAILELLEKLRVQLGDAVKQEERGNNYSYPSNKIDYWKRTFTQAFANELSESLLVLAHVNRPSLIKDFDFKCKTVVITKDTNVVNAVSESERFVVMLPQGFTEAEGLELFARALKKKNTMLPPEATELCRACKYNPFLINLIALRMSEECKHEVPINWQQHIDNLQNFSMPRPERVSRTIASTLEQFSVEEQQRFRDLVIFRDNVPMSLRLLQMYWELDKDTTEALLTRLERSGLLEKRVCKSKMFYIMQYICYNDIKLPPGSNMVNLHRRLLQNYSIRENLANRRELELTNVFPNDDYFHFHIAYHIEQAGEHDLFPELYQDFGFLEQKLRIAGLPNTVGDLRKYQEHIFPTADDREVIIDSLIDFLMAAECLLSEDTRLLQRALNFPGHIGHLAKQQVDRYKNRVWLRDVVHCFESSVIKLCHRPDKVRFQDANHVFVSLANNDIQLWNLSVEYELPPMTFKGCDGDQIKDVQRINQFLVALNRRGLIKVWSTKNPPDRPDYRMWEASPREAEMTLTITGGFACFSVLKRSGHTELIAISESGVLCVYKVYSSVFRTEKPDIKHPTNIRNAYLLQPFRDLDKPDGGAVRRCLFLVRSEDGTARGIVFNMMSTSVESCFVDEQPPLNVYQLPEGFLFVSTHEVRLRPLESYGLGQAKTIYERKACTNTCSVVTEDKRFLVLGTERGISVVNIGDGAEVRRMNISHSIVDLDVLMEDGMSQVLLASISKDGEHAMNLYSLPLGPVSDQYQLEGTTAFLATLDDDPVQLNTVDRYCRLQQTLLHDEDGGVSHEKTFQNSAIDAPVLCLAKTRSMYYVGLENGKLLGMTQWHADPTVVHVVLELGTEITYLECFRRVRQDDLEAMDILVASGKGVCRICVDERVEVELSETVRNCYLLYDRYMLLIGDRCSIQIYDFENQTLELVQKEMERTYGAAVYGPPPRAALILCTADGIVYHLGLHQAAIESFDLAPFDMLLTVKPPQSVSGSSSHSMTSDGGHHAATTVICSCALSADGEFLAIGCHDGRIILHLMEHNRQLGVLESHQFPVSALYFSSWTDPSAPHILVSVGDQIVFWSVDYLYNNQPRKSVTSIRLSGRFNTRRAAPVPDGAHVSSPSENRRSYGSNHSGFSTPVVGSPVSRSFLSDRFEESSQWFDKRGSTVKPHLLSCIKLIGRAKRLIMNREFSKFLTMDDEGYIHYLRFYRPSVSHLLMPPPANFGMRSPTIVTAAATANTPTTTNGTNGGGGGVHPYVTHLI
uniref:APAF-1 helical domain-containing protein n=1 Tax=Anopheles merus TaxID=30066 RepID=A0A182UM53_ANOME